MFNSARLVIVGWWVIGGNRRNTVRSFGEIQLTIFEKYSKGKSIEILLRNLKDLKLFVQKSFVSHIS